MILDRWFKGDNVVLADGVGVGKTMQCFMVMAWMQFVSENEGFVPPGK